KKRGSRTEIGHGRGDVSEHALHAFRKGTRSFRGRLRAPQLRGRHHLHGLGDLLRRLGRGDAHAHVFEAGHCPFSPRCLLPPPGRGSRVGIIGRRRTPTRPPVAATLPPCRGREKHHANDLA